MAEFNLEIYLPYIGCPCSAPGPEREDEGMKLQKSLLELKGKFDLTFMVYALNMHMHQFRSRPELAAILQEKGKKGLPVIFINERIMFQGRFPDKTELEQALMDLKKDRA